MTGAERRPLLRADVLVMVDHFCRVTGLDPTDVRMLVEAGRLSGVLDRHGRALALLEDDLPTAGQLTAMGLRVGADYDPRIFQGVEGPSDDEDPEPGGADDSDGPDWIIMRG